MDTEDYTAFVATEGKPTREDTPHKELVAYAALGLAGEAGEVAELIKKGMRSKLAAGTYRASEPMNEAKLALELGDPVWYATRLAGLHDMTLGDILEINRMKLIRRNAHGKDPKAEEAMAVDILAARRSARSTEPL